MQRLKPLVRVKIRTRVRWLQASATMVAGLQHAERRLELPWLRASTTMVAGLQQAAAPRASVAIG